MTTRSKGPLAGFGWLTRGISVGFRHPRPLFGGAALLLLLMIVPSMITLPLQLGMPHMGVQPSPAMFGWIMLGSALIGLLVVPLYGGYLQVVDAAERGLPARARDIFMPYRRGEALRLIGYALAMMLVYVAMIAIVIAVAGRGIATWYVQVLTAQMNHQPPTVGLPDGFGTAMALVALFSLFLTGFYAISLGQVALRRRGVFAAIGDGLVGALKNLLPLVVFALSMLVTWIVVGIAIVIVGALLAVLGKFVGVWLTIALVVPLYIALILGIFSVMFGVMYYLWRDVCGDDGVGGVAPIAA